MRLSPALRVEFDAVGAEFGGLRHQGGGGIHEEAHAAAPSLRLRDERADGVADGGIRKIEPVVGRFLAEAVGHERRLIGTHGLKVAHQIVEGVALDVVFAVGIFAHECGNRGDIRRADVALVGTRMNRQAGGARLKRDAAEEDRVGPVAFAGVAKKRHLVQIDGKLGTKHCDALLVFGTPQRPLFVRFDRLGGRQVFCRPLSSARMRREWMLRPSR